MAVPRASRRPSLVHLLWPALLGLLLVAAGCGDDEDDSASGDGGGGGEVTADDLDGRSFTSTSVEGLTLVEGTTVTLTFEAERMGANAGCNTMSSGYGVEGGTLVVDEPMAMTLMLCEDELAAQDQWLAALLASGPAIALDDGTLTLTGADATLTMAEAGADEAEGRSWAILSLEGPDGTLEAPDGATITLTDGAISVVTGCNTAFGEATIDGDTVTVGPLGSTRMACEDALMQWEAAVLTFLDGELTFSVDGDDLTLTKGDTTMALQEIPVS